MSIQVIKNFFSRLMRWVDQAKRLSFNIIFLLISFFITFAIISSIFSKITSKPVKDQTTLVLNLQGNVVEESAYNPQELFQQGLLGERPQETVLRDVIRALQYASEDDRIINVYLDLKDLGSIGLSSLREIARALSEFRESGKKIIYRGDLIDQRRYFLAAHADEIYLDPMGAVFFSGFGSDRTYFKEAFNKYGVNVFLVQTGEYKNFGETFVESSPTDATRRTDERIYEGLWSMFTDQIESARGLEVGSIMDLIDNFILELEQVNYDLANLALDKGFVDGFKTIHELRDYMISEGNKDPKHNSFRQISHRQYLNELSFPKTGEVAIIVAEGGIVDGHVSAGAIGGLSTSERIRRARLDENIKAIVLRVNSGGGSAFASEQIRRELDVAREEGKVVVISMGNVAASGGYWISLSSDAIVADKNTITGSIGVVSILSTVEKILDNFSLNVEGYATTWIREAMYDPRKELDPRLKKMIAGGIHKIYDDFLTLTSESREIDFSELPNIAQGRIWTGLEAKELGLIDTVGGLQDAISLAIEKAGLDLSTAQVFYLEREKSRFEQILDQLNMAQVFTMPSLSVFDKDVSQAMRYLGRELAWLAPVTYGIGINAENPLPRPLVHCFCSEFE